MLRLHVVEKHPGEAEEFGRRRVADQRESAE
jgi:hypothetical protein